MLEFLKKNKSITVLLFLKWDRFSRNAPEAYNMISVLGTHRIEAQVIEQPLDLKAPKKKIMLALHLTTGFDPQHKDIFFEVFQRLHE